jgi:hypothetical protein
MPKGLAHKTKALIGASVTILETIHPATVRAVCYRLFTQGLLANMGKAETDKVSRALTTARELGLIPWHWIVDDTRKIQGWQSWSDPAAFVEETMESYRRDWWQDQPQRLLVLSEKATVGGVLRPVLQEYAAQFLVLHGFGSATALKALANLSTDDERPLSLLYVGDHDPSGRHMSDVDIPERLERYDGDAAVIRLAVTPQQIALFDLPTFSVHDKAKDARYRWFLENHGTRCCELDALDPNVLREIVEVAITDRIDRVLWQRAKDIQKVEAQSLYDFISSWPGVA